MEDDRGPLQVTPGCSEQIVSSISSVGDSGMCGSKKWYYSTFSIQSGVTIYTYEDCEEFKPVAINSFKLEGLFGVRWSPLGSCLMGIKGNELIMVPNETSAKEIRLPVDGEVFAAEISPQEKFLLYISILAHDEKKAKMEIRDMDSRHIRETFHIDADLLKTSNNAIRLLRFDFSDNYFAFLDERRTLRIYETKTFSALDNLVFRKVRCFCWSPSASILAVFGRVRRHGVLHRCVRVVNISTGMVLRKIRSQTMFNCELLWHGAGDYLVIPYQGNIDISYFNQVVILSLKSDKIKSFCYGSDHLIYCVALERNEKRFAISYGTTDKERSGAVEFYSVQEEGGESEKDLGFEMKKLPDMLVSHLHWSPSGRHLVMRGPPSTCEELKFYDVDKHEVLAEVKFMAYRAEWDRTGRFFLTAACPQESEDVVRIWSSCGVKIRDVGHMSVLMLWSERLSLVAGSSTANESAVEKEDGVNVIGKRPTDFIDNASVSRVKIS